MVRLIVLHDCLPAKIDRCNLHALMPQFAADDLPRLFVLLPLHWRQCLARWPAAAGAFHPVSTS